MNKNLLRSFQHNSNLLVGWTFSLTPEAARVGDLAKVCVEIKFIPFSAKFRVFQKSI